MLDNVDLMVFLICRKHPSTNSGNQYTPKVRVFEIEMKEKERKRKEGGKQGKCKKK